MSESTTLTIADLERIYAEAEALKQNVYYGDAKFITRGTAYVITPEHDDPWIIINSDDLATLRLQWPNVRFVHLRDKHAA